MFISQESIDEGDFSKDFSEQPDPDKAADTKAVEQKRRASALSIPEELLPPDSDDEEKGLRVKGAFAAKLNADHEAKPEVKAQRVEEAKAKMNSEALAKYEAYGTRRPSMQLKSPAPDRRHV